MSIRAAKPWMSLQICTDSHEPALLVNDIYVSIKFLLAKIRLNDILIVPFSKQLIKQTVLRRIRYTVNSEIFREDFISANSI